MKVALNWIIGILFLMSLILSGVLLYREYTNPSPEHIYLHDTVTIHTDSIITKTKWKTHFDTITEIRYKDTVIHDTVRIPIEHQVSEFKIEKDSLKITEKIHHSGWHSIIDSVELDYTFNYEVKPPKQKKIGFVWYVGIGPSGGVNFNLNNRTFDYGPSFGI